MKSETAQLKNRILDAFEKEYGESPQYLISAPGRVNLIGEYTDLAQGFVLPMAIDRYLMVACRKRRDRQVRVLSLDYGESKEFSLDALSKSTPSWVDYVTGCLWVQQKKGFEVKGFDCVLAGNIPVGAGLSSSAALELAILRTSSLSADQSWDTVEMAKSGQDVENEWIGVKSGIMDQLICAGGEQGQAILIDCQYLSMSPRPIPSNTAVVVLDTGVRRGLVDSAYNERKEQCHQAAEMMGVEILRNADLSLLGKCASQISETTAKRAHHVITENSRVLEAADCMAREDTVRLGALMYQSHLSLRDDFEVSVDALNIIVECAMASESCYGARMTGAGFGGCAVAIVKKDELSSFIESVESGFREQTGNKPSIYACEPSSGVSFEKL